MSVAWEILCTNRFDVIWLLRSPPPLLPPSLLRLASLSFLLFLFLFLLASSASQRDEMKCHFAPAFVSAPGLELVIISVLS
ncbi:hypothetical protein E2C01_044546 [Portunus trituberculatus]|uniref:Uncharacterized protein n=1 Tax=Portunus trituberculatus TaxID=210409 RepID=A0A5B7FZG8_PORTR|nr:hypothetical protein [Portunus trituberculatus]